MDLKKPWEVHEELTEARINEIGRLIHSARWENLANEDDRDNGWSIGCRGYAWCMSEISELSGFEGYGWLNIVNPTLKFIFSIGGVNISFYKGDPKAPKKNIYRRAQAFPELRQSEIFIDDPSLSVNLIWTYAVETDSDGYTTNISFQGMTVDDVMIASHVIPIDGIVHEAIPDAPMHEVVEPEEVVEVEPIRPRIRSKKPEDTGKQRANE